MFRMSGSTSAHTRTHTARTQYAHSTHAAATGPPGAEDEGAARLVSRVDVNGFATGALQVFCEGAWGAVCTSNFDDIDASVACRQLGFTGGLRQPQEDIFKRSTPDLV